MWAKQNVSLPGSGPWGAFWEPEILSTPKIHSCWKQEREAVGINKISVN